MIVFGGETNGSSNNSWKEIDKAFSDSWNKFVGVFTERNWDQVPVSTAPLENVYVDTGFTNIPGTAFVGSKISNIDTMQSRKIVTQKPQCTIYVKKRAFWAQKSEHDPKYMGDGEKLLIRATKHLFENKCLQMAAYEGVTKVNQLLSDESVNYDADILYRAASILSDTSNTLSDVKVNINAETEQRRKDLAKILLDLSQKQREITNSTYTNWPNRSSDPHNLGRGAGVIELTSISSINTTCAFESGQFGLTLEDPLNISLITNDDIENAISAAYNIDNSKPEYATDYFEKAKRSDAELKRLRAERLNKESLFGGKTPPTNNYNSSGDLVFEIRSSIVSGDVVVGYLPSLPEPFTRDNFAIMMASLPTEQQLTSKEAELVKSIFDSLNEFADMLKAQKKIQTGKNSDVNVAHTRRSLRKFYLGKSILQPMDSVHVYMKSNSFRNSGLSGYADNSVFTEAAFKDLNNELSDDILEAEMQLFEISGLTASEYRTIRTNNFMRTAGLHVFAGVIETVKNSYNPGTGYILTASGQGVMKWLKMSRLNQKPSLDQTQGVLEDPLTPFDIIVDEATGLPVSRQLLQENIEFIKSGQAKYTSGPLAGNPVTPENVIQDYNSETPTDILQHVNGLQYRWKNGVITVTRNINLRTTLDGAGWNSKTLLREVGLTTIESPFANMDAANIVSILVTGVPHNYESFVRQASAAGTLKFNSDLGVRGYFDSIYDTFQKNNIPFGAFEPLQPSNVDRDTQNARLEAQSSLLTTSRKIGMMQVDIAKLKDSITSLNAIPGDISGDIQNSVREERAPIIAQKQKILEEKENELAELRASLNATKENATTQLKLNVYGSDSALTVDFSQPDENLDNLGYRKRAIINEIKTIRPQFKCKFNSDKNWFIVSDEYDKDLDIQAFVLNMDPDIKMFDSEFKFPYDTCLDVAKSLDMEFFADSQGNIRFRPPKYNKVPLSLLLKMISLQEEEQIKLYPDSLTTLFSTKAAALERERDSIKLKIEINNILLGITQTLENKYIEDSSAMLTINTNNTGNYKSLIEVKNQLASLTNGPTIDPKDSSNQAKAQEEIEAFSDAADPNVYSKRLAKLNDTAQMLSRLQTIESTLARMAKEGVGRGKPVDIKKEASADTINAMFASFADLIEDDFIDTLGPGSSKRFIITDDQIISQSFTESDKEVVSRVDVTGQLPLIKEGAGLVGGLPMIWAGATDFDLWRQYGYKEEKINKPYFRDAATQCAPYAQMLLTRSRKNAVTGTITVYGNEYYQLGDVVYVNSRDMLYYVTAVTHLFDYNGGKFTTELSLNMGHALGEYIPTPMDIIGKLIIKDNVSFNNIRAYRKTADKKTGVRLATLKFDSASGGSSVEIESEALVANENNIKALRNVLVLAPEHLRDKNTHIDIRAFCTGNTKDAANNRIEAVKNWLVSPYELDSNKKLAVAKNYIESAKTASLGGRIDKSDDALDPIQISNSNNWTRIPSSEAYSMTATKKDKTFTCHDIVEIFISYQTKEELKKQSNIRNL